jgi:hypothetical protein
VPAEKVELPEETLVAVASAVGAELGGDVDGPLVAKRPAIEHRDEDDGTNEYIRLRTLLGGDCSAR